jgi:hypothetical protein
LAWIDGVGIMERQIDGDDAVADGEELARRHWMGRVKAQVWFW